MATLVGIFKNVLELPIFVFEGDDAFTGHIITRGYSEKQTEKPKSDTVKYPVVPVFKDLLEYSGPIPVPSDDDFTIKLMQDIDHVMKNIDMVKLFFYIKNFYDTLEDEKRYVLSKGNIIELLESESESESESVGFKRKQLDKEFKWFQQKSEGKPSRELFLQSCDNNFPKFTQRTIYNCCGKLITYFAENHGQMDNFWAVDVWADGRCGLWALLVCICCYHETCDNDAMHYMNEKFFNGNLDFMFKTVPLFFMSNALVLRGLDTNKFRKVITGLMFEDGIMYQGLYAENSQEPIQEGSVEDVIFDYLRLKLNVKGLFTLTSVEQPGIGKGQNYARFAENENFYVNSTVKPAEAVKQVTGPISIFTNGGHFYAIIPKERDNIIR